MKEVKQQLDAMTANKTGLEDVAAKAADALDAEVQKYHALQEQSEAVDAEELHTARMELRGNMTAEVREKIKDTSANITTPTASVRPTGRYPSCWVSRIRRRIAPSSEN